MLKQGSYTGNSGTLLRFILHSLTTIWLLLCRRTVKHRKARCDNHQQAFSCFGRNCAEPTKFTLQRWSVRACRSSPTRKARGSNPPGRTRKPHCNVFFAMRFLLLLVFDFQNNFSSISSAASVYWPFARRSFLSLFIVIRMRRISSVEKVAFLSAGRALIFSISFPTSCVLCPSALCW